MNTLCNGSENQELRQSYAWARELTQRRALNFYYAIRLLPAERSDALCAVYAFFRDCDDISDQQGVVNRLQGLENWRRVLYGAAPSRPMAGLPAFYHTIETYDIPLEYFSDLIDGTIMDLEDYRYKTFADLYKYCYCVASTVGLVCIHIFGFDRSQQAKQMAEAQGIAFQITNILRDIAEDADNGRVYIPDEILEEYSLTRDDLLHKRQSPAFAAMVSHLAERAEHYYEMSADLPSHIEPCSRASLRAMTYIYHGILKKIKRLRGDVLTTRARLNMAEKLWLVLKACLHAWLENTMQVFNR